jgi:DNA repair protein RadC
MDNSSLSNIELLAQVVGIRAAKRLYRGTLADLFAPQGDVSRQHLQLRAARELVKRWLEEELVIGDILVSPLAVRLYLQLLFAQEEREVFAALFLSTQNRLIAAEKLFFGTLSQTAVYPREIVKRALSLNAGAVIFAHNHPSGVAEPSRADEMLTRTLKEALSLVDVRVLDHFVVGGTKTTSFAERGLI